jgi:hypothetical protein
VKMSQQKFASNVVEKCLTFGSPEQRQILINEMLGTTDENEPLQVCFQHSVSSCLFLLESVVRWSAAAGLDSMHSSNTCNVNLCPPGNDERPVRKLCCAEGSGDM